MNLGAMDKYIQIEYQTTSTSSTTGGRTQTWATLANVWATQSYPKSLESNREGVEQGRETAVIPIAFTIHYRTDIKEDMRILFESEYFDIKRVNRTGQRNELLTLITERKY